MAITNGFRNGNQIRAFIHDRYPVLSAGTVYDGGFVSLQSTDGYVTNPTTATYNRKILYVDDQVYAATGLTATAAGSVSAMTNVVNCVEYGLLDYPTFGDTLTQADVGKTIFLKDNGTLTAHPENSIGRVGTLTKYYSATRGEVLLNIFPNGDGVMHVYGALPNGTTGIAVFASTNTSILWNMPNPAGADLLVKDIIVRVETGAGTAVSGDIGITTSSSAGSADNLIDGVALQTAAVYSANGTPGTNGAPNRLWTSTGWLTFATTNMASTTFDAWYHIILEDI